MCTIEVMPLVFVVVHYIVPQWHVCSTSSIMLILSLFPHHMDLVCVRLSWYGTPPICTCIYLLGTVCFKLLQSLPCMIGCLFESTHNLFISIVLNYYLLSHAYVCCCIDDDVVTCFLSPGVYSKYLLSLIGILICGRICESSLH